MSIKQFNGTYHPREDRLEVRFNTPRDEEFKLWLTRRMTLSLMHFCEQFTLQTLSTKHGPTIAKDLDEFEQHALKQRADFATAYQPSTNHPLGESAVLVTGITLKPVDPDAEGKVNLSFQLENNMNLGMTISRGMLNAIRLLLDDLVNAAQWKTNASAATDTDRAKETSTAGPTLH